MPTIQHLLVSGRRMLAAHRIAEDDAPVMLSRVLNVESAYLYTHPEGAVTPRRAAQYRSMLRRRVQGFSVAVITGVKEFYNLRFSVTHDTHIPRPESELLVERGLEYLASKKNARVLDVGTGCGNLIISLAVNARSMHPACDYVWHAIDISTAALAVARKNALRHACPVHFFHSDLLNNAPQTNYDLLIANLPYLNRDQLKEPTLKREPVTALWGGESGTELYEVLLRTVYGWLRKNAMLLLEIDPSQREPLSGCAARAFPTARIQTYNDLRGQARVLEITLMQRLVTESDT